MQQDIVTDDEKTITVLLKSIIDLLRAAGKRGVDKVIKDLQKTVIIERSQINKELIKYISKGVCCHFKITEKDLLESKKYKHDIPRMIFYNLLWNYTEMKQAEIAKYCKRSSSWMYKNIKKYENLNLELKCDIEIRDAYQAVLQKIVNSNAQKIELVDRTTIIETENK